MINKQLRIFISIAICFFCSHFAKAQSTPLFDCGLTYFYDAGGNRILRMVVPCGDPSGKTSDSTLTSSNDKKQHTDSTTLASFQIVMIAPNPTAGRIDISCNQNLNNASVTVLEEVT